MRDPHMCDPCAGVCEGCGEDEESTLPPPTEEEPTASDENTAAVPSSSDDPEAVPSEPHEACSEEQQGARMCAFWRLISPFLRTGIGTA